MFFQSRQTKQAKHLRHAAKKLLNYRRDVLKPAVAAELEEGITGLDTALRSRDRAGIDRAMETLDRCCTKISPPRKDAGWRENCEVILVAIVIAVGVRAYFLQPFKIPTGSMQPTLNGIIGVPQETPAPNIIRRGFEYVALGRNYINVVSRAADNRVLEMREIRRFRFFVFTELICSDGRHVVYAPPTTLMAHFGVSRERTYNKGEPIARGYVDTGDQVFVDKVTYNFRRPKRGEVFVFKTTDISRIEETLNPAFGSQFYIKRLVGLPGDRLRIDPPELLVDGQPAREPMIRRVIDGKDGYRGYSNQSEQGGQTGARFTYLGHPEDEFLLPPKSYFAMGDNSFNSSDSRHWGAVPERNLVGRGFLVYWPFGKHWGAIR